MNSPFPIWHMYNPDNPEHKHHFVDENGVFQEDDYKDWLRVAHLNPFIIPGSGDLSDPVAWAAESRQIRENWKTQLSIIENYANGNLNPDQFNPED